MPTGGNMSIREMGSTFGKTSILSPMGFCYDSYITREEYDRVSEDNRNLLLLKQWCWMMNKFCVMETS